MSETLVLKQIAELPQLPMARLKELSLIHI